MKIGQLSSHADIPIETIRYYEREGLLPDVARSDANYRVYGDDHLERLAFIRNCRALDMTLSEVRTLLRHKDSPDQDCADVNALLEEHLGHVKRRIDALQGLARDLTALRERCGEASDAASCGILQDLSKPAGIKRPMPRGHVPGTHGLHLD